MNILLVEDWGVIRESIALKIGMLNSSYVVTTCSSAKEAREIIAGASSPFDLILLDCSLSEFDPSDQTPGGRPKCSTYGQVKILHWPQPKADGQRTVGSRSMGTSAIFFSMDIRASQLGVGAAV